MNKSVAIAIGLACFVSPARTQSSDWSLTGTVGVVSNYRFRGFSLPDERPALQAGLTASRASGVYGDDFVSTIDEYGSGPDGEGAEVEVTGTLDWAGQFGGFDVDVAAAAYRYPDGDDVNYVEFPLEIGRPNESFAWTIGVAIAPAQTALG